MIDLSTYGDCCHIAARFFFLRCAYSVVSGFPLDVEELYCRGRDWLRHNNLFINARRTFVTRNAISRKMYPSIPVIYVFPSVRIGSQEHETEEKLTPFNKNQFLESK